MKRIFDYTAQEIFSLLNDTSENIQIEAKGNADIHPLTENGKSQKDNYRSLMETICSFSNEPGLGGGVILLGVGENKEDYSRHFVVEGINDVDKAQNDISTQCKEVFNIPVHPVIIVEKIDGRNVLKICVSELSEKRKPLYFKKKGLPDGAYRRVGSSDLSCTDEDLYVFYQDSSISFDQTPIKGATINDIDIAAVERYRVLRSKVNPAAEELSYNNQELLESLGCVSVDDSNQLTLAGVLLFGTAKLQRKVIPTVRVDYIRVPGTEWIENPDESFRTIDMRGPLLLLVYRIVDAVNADLPKGFRLSDSGLQAEYQGIPVNVLREAIVNALMHRSYRVDRPTQVIRYDNRIEIINAGYSLKDEEKYNRPGSEIRNKFIAPVFHDTNLAETKGSGIKRMRELMRKANLASPTFESNRKDNSFTARFLLHHFLGEEDLVWLKNFEDFSLNDRQKTALIFVREVRAIDNLTYRQMNDCDTLKASKELREMRDSGLLEDKGKGSATYYIPGKAIIGFISPDDLSSVKNDDPQQLELGISSMGGASHENEPGTQVIEPNTHASEPNIHASEPNTHASEPNTHASEPNTHASEPNTHASFKADQLTDLPPNLQKQLIELKKRENDRQIICDIILDLCAIRPMTKKELSKYLGRKEDYLKKEFLQPLLSNKKLKYLYPEVIRHPNQAYITNRNISASN